ncbi:MAG: hypothetical protein IPK91_11185 [Saprospiraceae bacterium]|nr:hypothetical protein [Saprospiraceae bacterium]
MSCQPNEYSIEGEQWGGGRGAFSYHLIDALYGMADNNNDLIVNLQEAGRYIEDHVSAEVAPVSQVPMVLGNRTEALSKVDPNLLASIKSGKSSQMGFLSSIDTRGMEEDVLALVDTSVRLTYKLFKQAIKDKIFLEPASACAEMYYNQLIKEPKLERLHSTLRRNYAAALMDEGQQAINDFVTGNVKAWEKMEEEIGFSNRKTADKFYRAAALLGEKHYLYSKVKAKALYFEAFTVYHLPISWDSANVLDIRLMKQAISLDPDSPILWYNLAFFVTTDSLDFYIDRLNELVPNWPVWNGMIGWRFEKINPERAVGFYQKAITLDSTYLKASNRLALLLDTIGRHEEATQYREKIVRIALRKVEKNVKSLAHEEWFSLLISLYRLNRGIETEKLIEQYIALDPKELLTYWTLAEMYSRLRHYKEGEQILKRYILLDPTNSNVYLSIAYFQTTQNHIDQAFGTLELAMKNGLNYSYYDGLQTDPEIAPLRERTEQWDALMKKYFPEKIK